MKLSEQCLARDKYNVFFRITLAFQNETCGCEVGRGWTDSRAKAPRWEDALGDQYRQRMKSTQTSAARGGELKDLLQRQKAQDWIIN